MVCVWNVTGLNFKIMNSYTMCFIFRCSVLRSTDHNNWCFNGGHTHSTHVINVILNVVFVHYVFTIDHPGLNYMYLGSPYEWLADSHPPKLSHA